MQPELPVPLKATHLPYDAKGLLFNISYSAGIRGSQGEWLYDANKYLWHANDVDNVKYGKDGYTLCYYHLVSADLMSRYARRYASGIGLDALYEPYNRVVEIQNDEADRSNLPLWSWGLAAKHEVFFRRLSMKMAIGCYLSRPLNAVSNTTEEYPYYERIGIRYNLPLLDDRISVGYNIYAHATKAYGTELVIDLKLPFSK